MKEFTEGTENYKVSLNYNLIGDDLCINIFGGTSPHIGAVSIACPRPSLSDYNIISSSASTFCVIGHKEDELARNISLKLSSLFNKITVVTVGIHIDNATVKDIEILSTNTNKVVELFIDTFKKGI